MEKSLSVHAKGQVFYADFILGITLFVITILVFWNYYSNYSMNVSEISVLTDDAVTFGSELNSRGYPESWDKTDVIRLGITNSFNRINNSKLELMANMTPDEIRKLTNLEHEFYFYLETTNGTRIPMRYRVNATVNRTIFVLGKDPVNASHLVETKRLMIYKNEIIHLVIQIWE
jgi:hypothetical protein